MNKLPVEAMRSALAKAEAQIDTVSLHGTSPDQLFHYTSLMGLQGIVQTGSLWASSVSYLNDSRELQHGLDMCHMAAETLARAKTYEHWREHLTWMISSLADSEIPLAYAVCFCERSDLLSQWRGYGGAEQSVTIGFHAKNLQNQFSAKMRLANVIYGATKTKQALRKLLLTFCKQVGTQAVSEDVRQEFLRCIHRCVPRFKHFGFREEQEWRLIVQRPKMEHLEFRVNRTRLVPYLVLASKTKRLPIKSVRIGPGNDAKLTAQGLRSFLAEHGYESVPVWLSKIPYRP